MTPEELLKAIESKCKAEGYADTEEMIGSLRANKANLKQAEEARDKFAEESKELKKHLGSKGGELGFLKQKVEELEKELEQAKGASNSEQTSQAAPTKVTPAPSKPIEEELAEVEATLTDEQWELADKMLEAVEDDGLAKKLAMPTEERLEILKGIGKDIEILPRPKSLRPQKRTVETAPPNDGESLFDQLKKKMTATSVGPQGGVLRTRPGMKQDERPIHKAFG